MKAPDWVKISRIGMKEYFAAFCLTVFLAVLLLAAAAFLPQKAIQNHILESQEIISRDLNSGSLFDNSPASKLDVGTDLMILRTSLMTNSRYPGSILTNPIYDYDDSTGPEETLTRLAYDMPTESVWYYAKYWMGFRVIMRLALSFFNYAQIKRYMAFLFLSLFAAVICSVSKHTNSKIAFLFSLSIILIRPHVMATSMQFTCCFFIAFAAMLLVPWLHKHGKWEGLFFMELGMFTMYFDFYTVPLVTLGFPLMYLYILRQEKSDPISVKKLFRNMAVWFLGYGSMWIAKLVLTSLLTPVDAVSQGIQSFFVRVGVVKDVDLLEYYSAEAAFEGVRKVVFSDEMGSGVYLLCAGMILLATLYMILRKQVTAESLRASLPYLFFATIPLVWFVITKQPIAVHSYFQYRTIALTHWASGVFLYYLLSAKDKALTSME